MSILDPKFRYRPSYDTNVMRTVRRERKRLALEAAREAERQARQDAETARVVAPLARRKS
jgi:hypothetical protein